VSLIALSLTLLLIAPLAALALRSVTRLDAERGQRGPVQTGFTLDYYRELSINRRNSLFYVPPIEAIGNSLAIAGTTVALALAFGLPTAWALAQNRHRASQWFDALLMLPLGTSPVTLGLGFILALDSPPLDLRASPLLLPLAHTLVAFPFVVRSLTPALRSLKPRLKQAAAVLGASPLRAWREVELPLLGRAVLVAAAFAFTVSLGEFGATALLARPEHPTIPIAIYRFIGLPGALNYGQALALSTLLMLTCAICIAAIERFRIGDIGEF
jgi:thiamine transport system permease protein